EVEQVEDHHERLLAAVERLPRVEHSTTVVAQEDADRVDLFVVDRGAEVLVDVDCADDTHGSFQPMRSRNISNFTNGARETMTNDVSFACRCDSGPMWSAIIEHPSQPCSQSGPNMKCCTISCLRPSNRSRSVAGPVSASKVYAWVISTIGRRRRAALTES